MGNVINSPGYRSTVIDNNKIYGDGNVTAGGDVHITREESDPSDFTKWPWPVALMGGIGLLIFGTAFFTAFASNSTERPNPAPFIFGMIMVGVASILGAYLRRR